MEGAEWCQSEYRKPVTGVPCFIAWQGVVQLVAYHRMGIGFACKDGYEWRTVIDLGAEPIPDNEVEAWMQVPQYESPTWR
jgi:hypothetical protein